MLSNCFRFLIICLSIPFALSAQKGPDKNYKFLHDNGFVASKNYYLLTLFQEVKEVRTLLESDTMLNRIRMQKINAINDALAHCDRNAACFTNALKFTDSEITAISERLQLLWKAGNALDRLVINHLIPSGTYILFQQLIAAQFLAKAFTQDVEGINFAIGVYANGNKPNYPLIDSISIKSNNVSLIYNTTSLIGQEVKANLTNASVKNNPSLFFSPSLLAALHFIELNEREQVADYEPMSSGENKPASDRIKSINWNNYKYSVIVLPGAGPDEQDVALSAEGMLRCRLAALQYHKGLAPFIIPSGGKVHPYKTKFNEAIEMKKYLIEKLNVPANAIIIEPHARHTTTNMRNAVRLIYRYGIPFNKMGITCTTRSQSTMIEKTLIDRCMRELNEVPYKNGQRLSETEVEFYPLIEALHINPKEPMDP